MAVKVLIVDDSAFFRKRLNEILSSVDQLKVVGSATNGKEAVDLAKELKPDVVTMDYEMPVMDGITAIKHIMKESPCAILMFSSLSYEGARVTLDALDAGAVDFLPKNFEDIARDAAKMQDVLKSRILSIARQQALQKLATRSASRGESTLPSARSTISSSASSDVETGSTTKPKLGSSVRNVRNHPVDLLAIGTSTGGPVALQKIITKLPSDISVPILLVQHMPATFTPAFAERLDNLSKVQVKEASNGEELRPGVAYLAPGGKQMLVTDRGGRKLISIIDGDERLTYKPSVDLSFGSANKAYPGRILSIVLTGMGADGKEGCRLLKESGSTVWTQSEATCVVYGMPMVVDKAGYSDRSLDLDEIAGNIVNRLA